MNLDKTEYNNSFTKSHKLNIFKRKTEVDNPFQKLVPTFQLSNYTTKSQKNPLFLRTSNLYFSNTSLINNKTTKSSHTQIKYLKRFIPKRKIQIRKIKIKKSLSEIFQNNDIDLVRNLNIDSMAQFNDNMKLKENLINLSQDYFEQPKEKKMNKFFFNYNNENDEEVNDDLEEQKNRREKLPILNRSSINKSYELLQARNRELKLEMSENAEKDVINKIKIIRKEMNIKISKKKEYFDKIKELDEELQEIDEENQFVKDIYLKEINDISKDKKKGIDILDEIIKYKIKSKFYTKNKNIKSRQSFLQVLSLKKNKSKAINDDIEDSSIENDNTQDGMKQQGSKRLENFEKNMKKSNKKKKYDNFMKEQEEKINELKKEKKIYEDKVNEIEIEIDKDKKNEKIIVDKLMMSYKESLFKGKHVKSEGLVWIIKAIWNLGENVPMSFMPNFLDCESIDYLFKLARKQNSMDALNKKILELKMKLKKKVANKTHLIKSPNKEDKSNEAISNNKSLSVKAKLILRMEKENKISENEKKKDIYRDLVNQFKGTAIKFEIINMPEINMIKKLEKEIKKTKEEISELKTNEVNRIIKCFIEKNYENIYHTKIDTVLAALIGLDEKDAEVNRFNIVRKNHYASIKQIRFYDHKYVSKKISA